MLVLTRKSGERIQIRLRVGLGEVPATELFAARPIEIVVTEVHGNQVRLGIVADRRLVILREELCGAGKEALGTNGG